MSKLFPFLWPLQDTGMWICTMSGRFCANLNYFGSVVLEKKQIQLPHSILAFLCLYPLGREPSPSCRQFFILSTKGWLVPSLIEIGPLVLEKNFFFNINMVIWFSLLWPFPTLAESFHVNISLSGSVVLEKIFKWPQLIFTYLWLSPLWRGPGPLLVPYRSKRWLL
jgi:hypothetical protein